jgi:hypothetical protein
VLIQAIIMPEIVIFITLPDANLFNTFTGLNIEKINTIETNYYLLEI